MSLGALREAMGAVNRRYLCFISQWPDRTRERHDLRAITSSVRDAKGHSHRGVNFFREEDLQLMTAVSGRACRWKGVGLVFMAEWGSLIFLFCK